MRLTPAAFLSMLLLSFAACAPAGEETAPLVTLTLQLGSTHQALYAGFYAADQNGYYAEEGLAVHFLEGSATDDLVTPMLDGTAQFGLLGATVLIAERSEGKPVRVIATLLRRDPVVFFSLADSRIIRLEDFVGKTVQVSARILPRLHAMLDHAGIDQNSVNVLTTASVADLYRGAVDIGSGVYTSVVLRARQDGYQLNVIYPDDYGVHLYSTSLFTTDDFIAEHSDLVLRFLRASLQGWNYAVENPDAAGRLVPLYNPAANGSFEAASMAASVPYINTGEDHIGWMKPEDWESMAQLMREQYELANPVNVTDVYTLEFIEQIYGAADS